MVPKYDEPWRNALQDAKFREALFDALRKAVRGNVSRIDVPPDIAALGGARSGTIRVRFGSLIRSNSEPMVHAKSLGKQVVADGMLAEWPHFVFRLSINGTGKQLTVAPGESEKKTSVTATEFIPPTRTRRVEHRAAPLDSPISNKLVDAHAKALISAQRMPTDSVEHHPDLDKRGIYAWYADDVGHSTLRRAGLTVRDDDRPVYIGKTLAKRGFRHRVLDMHIRGTAENSTLRKTLSGVLKAGGYPSNDVSNFMGAHLTVALLAVDDEARIPCTELKLIKMLEPALCVDGLETPNAKRVKNLRRG